MLRARSVASRRRKKSAQNWSASFGEVCRNSCVRSSSKDVNASGSGVGGKIEGEEGIEDTEMGWDGTALVKRGPCHALDVG